MGQGGHFSRAQKYTDTKTQSEASEKPTLPSLALRLPDSRTVKKRTWTFLGQMNSMEVARLGSASWSHCQSWGRSSFVSARHWWCGLKGQTPENWIFFFLTFKETFALPTSGSFFFVVTFPQMLKKEWNSPYQVNCAYAKLTSTPLSGHLDAINRPHKTKRLLCLALVGIRFHSAFFSKNFSIKMAKERWESTPTWRRECRWPSHSGFTFRTV